MVKTETIGILSLQGDFLEHEMMIQAIKLIDLSFQEVKAQR